MHRMGTRTGRAAVMGCRQQASRLAAGKPAAAVVALDLDEDLVPSL